MINFISQNYPALIIFVAGIAGAWASLISTQQQDALNQDLINSQSTLKIQQEKNIELAQENTKLSNELRGKLTGGDSYLLVSINMAKSPYFFSFQKFGTYPLRNIRLSITHQEKYNEGFEEANKRGIRHPNELYDAGDRAGKIVDEKIDYLKGANYKYYLETSMSELEPEEKRTYTYEVIALNGISTGAIYVFKTKNNKYLVAESHRLLDGSWIYKPEGYPRIGEGNIPDWENFNRKNK